MPIGCSAAKSGIMVITDRARRLLWFIALWAAGVLTVGAVSLIIKAWIGT